MKITRKLIERIDIAKFADRHDLEMVVKERNSRDMADFNVRDAFYAYFEGAEVKEGVCLSSMYGSGGSEDEAIKNYADRISGRVLVFNAFHKDRREITVPYLHYKKA